MKDIKDSKIAVVGVGGVGGYIGGMLAKYYPHVSFVARGARGESIREKGFVLHSDYKGEILVHPETVAGSSRELEKQDIIFVCVKNYSLESACEELKGAVGPDTVVVPVMNGVDPAERTAKTLGAGIVVNGLSTWLLHLKKGKDLNAQGAFLHMLADTLVSIGVVVAGVIISLTGIYIIDPIISLIIVVVILASTWHLLSASLRLSLDGIPEDIDPDEIERKILQVPHVESLHHVHIWALSTEENALTAHIVVDRPENIDEAKHAIREVLAANDIAHATLEMEHHGEQCTCPCD